MPDLKQVMKFYPGLSNYPGLTFKAQLSSVLCAAYKIHGQPETKVLKAWDYARWSKDINDDYTLLKEISKVMNSADAIVTHNGKRFDWKFLQTRLGLKDLPFIHDIPHIDTCSLAKANLTMFNNRLGNLTETFFNDDKLENGGWALWERIQFEQNPKDLELMAKYCKQDVDVLDKLFTKLRPFAKNIPNYNMWSSTGDIVCPSCGGTKLKNNGYRNTKTMSYKRLLCLNCGSSSRTDIRGYNARSI